MKTNLSMRRAACLSFLLGLTALFSPGVAQDTIKIACVGNSITQGVVLPNPSTQAYPALLQKMFGTKYKVYNYGISGSTMLKKGDYPYWVYTDRFDQIFSVKPNIITIKLGTNDSKPQNWKNTAGFINDYLSMIDTFSRIATHPIIMPCLPVPCVEGVYGISDSVITRQIIPRILTVAKTRNLTVIDANTPFLDKLNLMPDGVHPDTGGNKVLADIFYEAIQNSALKRTPPVRLLWFGNAPGARGTATADKPFLAVYPAPDSVRNGAAAIVCPGGGYSGLATGWEGTNIAAWLNRYGITAFVLSYRYSPYRYPVPINDGKRAMRLVRYYASSFKIDTTRIGIVGFSAGGHLASMVGTHPDGGNSKSLDPIERMKSRPAFMVLGYPVITMKGPYAHTGSRDNLLGTSPGAALVDTCSTQLWVRSTTPPTFLTHGDSDKVVPMQNSMMFDSACKANKVPEKLVIEPGKQHGYNLDAPTWPNACIAWLRSLNFLTPPTGINSFSAGATKGNVQPVFIQTGSKTVRITLSPSAGTRKAEIFSIDGRKMVRFTGSGEWRAPARGVYILHSVINGKPCAHRLWCQ